MQDDKNAIFQMRFPQKLWYLLNLRTEAILWGGTGRTILLNYRVLHNYLQCDHSIFKTTNISSFVRQLNLYGFRKVTSHLQDPLCNSSNPYMHEYVHDFFQYGRPELLNKITRKALAMRKHFKPKSIYGNTDQYLFVTPLQKARRALHIALRKAAQDLFIQNSPMQYCNLQFDCEDPPEDYCDDEENIELDWILSKSENQESVAGVLPTPGLSTIPDSYFRILVLFVFLIPLSFLQLLNQRPEMKTMFLIIAPTMKYKCPIALLSLVFLLIVGRPLIVFSVGVVIMSSTPDLLILWMLNLEASQDSLMNFTDEPCSQQTSDSFPNQFLSMPELDAAAEENSGVELLAEFDIDHDIDQGIARKIGDKNDHNSLNCVLPSISNDQIDDVSMAEKNNDGSDHYHDGEWDQMFNDIIINKGSNQECGSDLKELYSQISRTIDLLNS